MAKDTVILSPEYAGNVGRREATATGAIQTGVFLELTAGQVSPATAAVAVSPCYISTENIATAQGLGYSYATDENVFYASLPRGVLVNVIAAAATYNAGDEVEVAAGGGVTAQVAGVVVGVVPANGGEIIGAGGYLMIELV